MFLLIFLLYINVQFINPQKMRTMACSFVCTFHPFSDSYMFPYYIISQFTNTRNVHTLECSSMCTFLPYSSYYLFHYYNLYNLLILCSIRTSVSSFMCICTPVSCAYLTFLLCACFTTSPFAPLYLSCTPYFILYYSYCLYMAILSHLCFKIATCLPSPTSAIYKKESLAHATKEFSSISGLVPKKTMQVYLRWLPGVFGV